MPFDDALQIVLQSSQAEHYGDCTGVASTCVRRRIDEAATVAHAAIIEYLKARSDRYAELIKAEQWDTLGEMGGWVTARDLLEKEAQHVSAPAPLLHPLIRRQRPACSPVPRRAP